MEVQTGQRKIALFRPPNTKARLVRAFLFMKPCGTERSYAKRASSVLNRLSATMILITLPDGSRREFSQPVTVAEVAASIGSALAKAALAGVEIRYRQASIIDELKSAQDHVDFVSLSNVPSYFTGTLEREFLQEMAPGLATGARVVLRHYLHTPEATNRLGYRNLSADFQSLFLAEKVGMYEIELLSKL